MNCDLLSFFLFREVVLIKFIVQISVLYNNYYILYNNNYCTIMFVKLEYIFDLEANQSKDW